MDATEIIGKVKINKSPSSDDYTRNILAWENGRMRVKE